MFANKQATKGRFRAREGEITTAQVPGEAPRRLHSPSSERRFSSFPISPLSSVTSLFAFGDSGRAVTEKIYIFKHFALHPASGFSPSSLPVVSLSS